MEQKNNKQDRTIFDIEGLLNKMSNQVNFLIRKDIPLNQLDVDLLMENTRKLYDTICSIELGVENEECIMNNVECEIEENLDSEFIDSSTDRIIDSVPVPEEDIIPEENPTPEKEADMVWDFTINNEELGVRSEELGVRSEELGVRSEELGVENEGSIMNNIECEIEENLDSEFIDSSTDEYIDSEEEEEEDVVPSPITNIYSAQTEEDSGIKTYKIVRENATTISDKLEQSVDNSLAARLQRKPVTDIISAIGINDKFLFLNELFGGSMEKYNKSIRSLNSFSTLLGAKTYMS